MGRVRRVTHPQARRPAWTRGDISPPRERFPRSAGSDTGQVDNQPLAERRWRLVLAGRRTRDTARLPADGHRRPSGDRRGDPAAGRARHRPRLVEPRARRYFGRAGRLDRALGDWLRHARVRADGAARDRADQAAPDRRGGLRGDGAGGGGRNDAGAVPQPHGRPRHHRGLGGWGAGGGGRHRRGPDGPLLPRPAGLRLRGSDRGCLPGLRHRRGRWALLHGDPAAGGRGRERVPGGNRLRDHHPPAGQRGLAGDPLLAGWRARRPRVGTRAHRDPP